MIVDLVHVVVLQGVVMGEHYDLQDEVGTKIGYCAVTNRGSALCGRGVV